MSPEMPVARLCALPEPRPPRASRSPKRAEVRHPAVDVTGAPSLRFGAEAAAQVYPHLPLFPAAGSDDTVSPYRF
jgi:hypothetical protein